MRFVWFKKLVFYLRRGSELLMQSFVVFFFFCYSDCESTEMGFLLVCGLGDNIEQRFYFVIRDVWDEREISFYYFKLKI